MRETFEERVRELAKRAGLGEVSPRVVQAGLLVLAVCVALGCWRWWPRGTDTAEIASVEAAPASSLATPVASVGASAEPSTTPRVWVHVVGAVRRPGLYELAADSRVESAVVAAGGLLGNAAPEAVNLARRLTDGEQVSIPTQDEAKRGISAAPSAPGGGAEVGVGAPGQPVDINTATAEQLDTLPGIGPATAAKIVADRDANGAYSSVEDLGRVTGIGPKKLEELKDRIRVQ